MPENGEQFKMSTCRKCKIARYCTDACFKKHKYIHYLMCDRDNYITKLNSLVCLVIMDIFLLSTNCRAIFLFLE